MVATEVMKADIVVIGSGPGGGTMAFALRVCGADVLLVEQGDFLPSEEENWSPTENFVNMRYKADTTWIDAATDAEFRPNLYQYVGGCSKVWGSVLARMRPEDFDEIRHEGGISPAWPISYEELAPYYDSAEILYGAHGRVGKDPTAPKDQPQPPYDFVGHSPTVSKIVASMETQGVNPFELPVGVDVHESGSCILCSTCDGFPCRLRAKNDAEMRAVRPALESGNVRLSVRTRIDRLVCSEDGRRVRAAVGHRDGQPIEVHAERFVLSAGAALSAAILLRSANENHPRGLANSSDQVGRNYMQHVFSAILATDPLHRTNVGFQKTAGLNDFYLSSRFGYPLGNIQGLGKLTAEMIKPSKSRAPVSMLKFLEHHSTDWWATTEDLPDPSNRVTLDADGRIRLFYRPKNLTAHGWLVREAKQLLRKAGFPIVFASRLPITATAAQCGTLRFGEDPRTSVLNPVCQTHDVDNLWVVDGSHMTSSSATNPGLSIAAQALRLGAVGGVAV